MTVLTVDADRPDQSGEFALWVAAVVIVLALHVGLALAYLRLRPEPETRAEAPAFDVAFMPAESAPAAPPAVDQPDPAPTKMDQPEDPPKELPPPPVPDEPPPPPQVEAMVPPEEPPPPAPLVQVEPVPPPIPEEATVVPPEKPVEAAPPPPKPAVVRAPPPRKVTHDEKVEKRPAPPKSVAAPASKPMRVAAAPNPGAESEGARLGLESWLSQFAAQIRRAASYPAGATGSGTAQVSVTVARNGRVVSRRLVASAGSAALDQAALAAIDRAQPFPPFPASMSEAQISRMVPLHLRPH